MSARWEGKLLAPSSETFTLYVKADDAARLYVDHELVIDAWEGRWIQHQACLRQPPPGIDVYSLLSTPWPRSE